MAAVISNPGDYDLVVSVQLHYASAGVYELLAEAADVVVAASSERAVELEWDPAARAYPAGFHRLWVSVLSVDHREEPLAVANLEVLLSPADAIFVMIGANQSTIGSIVGTVAKPSVVAAPEYPPTPTPTAVPAVDAEIVGIVSDPATVAIRSQWVNLSVEVRNNGVRPLRVPVQLTFPSANKQPEVKRPLVQPNETAVATFVWKTRDYQIGRHVLRVDLLLDENITSGADSQEIVLQLVAPAIAASIDDVVVSPRPAVVGEPVSIAVTVRNASVVAANIPVTLHFPSADKQPETRRPRVGPGATGVATFTWRTSRYEAGSHTFRVEAPGSSRTFIGELVPPTVDFHVSDFNLAGSPGPIARGDSMAVSAVIGNGGPHPGRATVTLMEESSGEAIDNQTLSLQPEESQAIAFTWRTRSQRLGTHRLRVVAQAPNDSNPDNDASLVALATIVDDASVTLGYAGDQPAARMAGGFDRPQAPTLPRLAIAGISMDPERPVAGEPVSIIVEIVNRGGAAGSAPVTLRFPSTGKLPETRRPRVGAGQTGHARFTWRTGRYDPGGYTFHVDYLDDSVPFHATLLPPTVDFVVDAIYPPRPSVPVAKGDWTEVAALVRNLGPYEGRATVTLRAMNLRDIMYAEQLTLAPNESRVVTFTWKTLRYDVGQHRLRVEAAARYDVNPGNNHSNTVRVELLTNRDVTLGFQDDRPGPRMVDETTKPRVSAAPEEPEMIMAIAPQHAPRPAEGGRIASPGGSFGARAAPRPDGAASSILDAEIQNVWTWPFVCAVQQRLAATPRPSSGPCAGVRALIR